MSYVNLYGIEVYRMALRDTVNEGGDDKAERNKTSTTQQETQTQAADTMEKARATDATASEQQEVGDVVKLDPIATHSKPTEAAGSSQRVLLVTRPSQRYGFISLYLPVTLLCAHNAAVLMLSCVVTWRSGPSGRRAR